MELWGLVKKQGRFVLHAEGEGRKLDSLVKKAIIHGVLSNAIVEGGVYYWLQERGRHREDYRPRPHQVLLSVVALGVLLVTGYLGGSLVYDNSVGVKRGKTKKGEWVFGLRDDREMVEELGWCGELNYVHFDYFTRRESM